MALIKVKVKPQASATKFKGILDLNGGKILKIDVAAPPEKGKANEELIKFLAKKLKVQKGEIAIKSGATSREKQLEINGLSFEKIIERLKNG